MSKVFGYGAMLLAFNVFAAPESDKLVYPGATQWGIAAGQRTVEIPYISGEERLADFIPLMYFQGDNYFMHGDELGGYLYRDSNSSIDLFARLRLFDIPKEYNNQYQGDSYDFGVRYRHELYQNLILDFEMISDSDARYYGNIAATYYWKKQGLELWPTIALNWRSGDFNTFYYGLDQDEVDNDLGYSVGVDLRYHLWKNLYLISNVSYHGFGSEVTSSQFMNSDNQSEFFIGLGLFPQPGEQHHRWLGEKDYIRVAHGWGTPSNIGEVLSLNWVEDENNHQLTSLFYGKHLSDELFDLPIEVYLHTGIAIHHPTDFQNDAYEGVLSLKAYYTFQWPIKVRVGAAEGLSYITDVTFIEQTEMDAKGYESSKLLNYLDFTIDMNVGDLMSDKKLKDLWFGWGVHHRSGIFESASQFGRIKGGSNYHNFYLQWHF